MKPIILVAVLVVFLEVLMADEEKRFFFKKCKSNSDCTRKKCCTKLGKCEKCILKKCRSDSECGEGQCCRRRKCRSKCIKRCKFDSDCNEGQCCLKIWKYGKCQAYQQEGDKCYVKKSFFMKRNCGCAEGLECQPKGRRYRRGKCTIVEGSGEI